MLKERIKKYSFWTGLSAALVVLFGVISKCFGFSIDNQQIEDIVMGVCGVLMALGIVCRPTKKELKAQETKQKNEEIDVNSNKKTEDKNFDKEQNE